ncbi:unnamed protein product [Phytophthora lilii]|uniref:Unnamed protein product n=1 Tax=Phytophthora lilii TaxID=2077276 RepID=A0A9W6TML0_9STRA|nr:unnamed protein product [Phytophthora lilii]
MDGDFLHAINGDWDSLLTAMRENRQVAQRTDASGMTVLHWVCLHQNAPTDIVVKVVFANPYAVHMRNDAGHLPIDLAVQAECGERILEVLRAAANGSRGPEDDGELHQHDLMGKDDGEPATETIDYQLPYNNHTILHDDIRDGSDYQPHQNHTYYGDGDSEVDEDELEYQQHHRHYQPQPFQQQPPRKGRLERSVSDQDSFYGPPQGNYASMYGGFGVGPDRDRIDSLSRSDPHVKSLLTEQRLRERENDLISIATADDSIPLGMFDPSKGPPDMSLMSSFQEDAKSSHANNVNMSSRSIGAGPPTAPVPDVAAVSNAVPARSVDVDVLVPAAPLRPSQLARKDCRALSELLESAEGECVIMADRQEATQEEPGCWQKKAAYEQCFDKWYTEVFLQQKAHGKVGCQKEYEAYTRCYLVRGNGRWGLVGCSHWYAAGRAGQEQDADGQRQVGHAAGGEGALRGAGGAASTAGRSQGVQRVKRVE